MDPSEEKLVAEVIKVISHVQAIKEDTAMKVVNFLYIKKSLLVVFLMLGLSLKFSL
jgi:hypothetical protein